MPKKSLKSILVLSSAEDKFTQSINDAFAADLNNLKPQQFVASWCNYQDVGVQIQGDQAQAFLTADHQALSSFDLVYFKSYYRYQEQAAAIADSLQQQGTGFIGQELQDYCPAFKLSQMTRLAIAGAPVPATLYMSRSDYLTQFDYLVETLGMPFVFKAIDGRTGDDNHLINSRVQLQAILQSDNQSQQYIAQSYVENDGDYRFLVLGGQTKLAIYRQRTSAETHLNNTSKGASAALVPLSQVAPGLIKLANQAAEITGRDVAGVDIMQDKRSSEAYILEVNASPQLASGAFKAEKLAVCSEYFKSKAEENKLPVGQVGRAETISFPGQGIENVPAKTDTGADRSSIWASDINETRNGHLQFKLFGPGSQFYTGETLEITRSNYHKIIVENSFGEREERYVVKLSVVLKSRRIRGSFSLADRSSKTYPVLLGRRLLHGKFLVDVSAGEPLADEERHKTKARQKGIKS